MCQDCLSHIYQIIVTKCIDFVWTPSLGQNVPVGPNNKPKLPIVIAQCGEM